MYYMDKVIVTKQKFKRDRNGLENYSCKFILNYLSNGIDFELLTLFYDTFHFSIKISITNFKCKFVGFQEVLPSSMVKWVLVAGI